MHEDIGMSILVLGNSGSGKSTLARRQAAQYSRGFDSLPRHPVSATLGFWLLYGAGMA